jgi:hypothetical protein
MTAEELRKRINREIANLLINVVAPMVEKRGCGKLTPQHIYDVACLRVLGGLVDGKN